MTANQPYRLGITTFSLFSVIYLRLRFSGKILLYFHTWPKHYKACFRWFGISEIWLMQVMGKCFQVQLRKPCHVMRHGSEPEITLQALKETKVLTENLTQVIQQSGHHKQMSKLIGEWESEAFFHRRLSWDRLYFVVLMALEVAKESDSRTHSYMCLDPDFSQEWENEFCVSLSRLNCEMLLFPGFYRNVSTIKSNIKMKGLILGIVFTKLVSQITKKRVKRKSAKVAVELVDFHHMGGDEKDSNFFEDEKYLPQQEVLYFITQEHEPILQKNDKRATNKKRDMLRKGFRIVNISTLHISTKSLQKMAHFALWSVFSAETLSKNGCMSLSLWKGVQAYSEYAALLDNYQIDHIVYTQNPNGRTGGRFDSAVVSSLCRAHRSKSVGYQNRVIYDSTYEDSYDCYDVYFAWGRRWLETLGAGFRYVQDIRLNGNLAMSKALKGEPVKGKQQVVPRVSIFTLEWDGAFSTPQKNIRFMIACLELAEQYPRIDFIVKTKDPQMVNQILEDRKFAAKYRSNTGNFSFLKLQRHDCQQVIENSEIVIAAGFTTPGTDALLQGKRVIYFTEIPDMGKTFEDFPDFVARDPGQLTRIFEIATKDFRHYVQENDDLVKGLDSCRDGRPIQRISEFLAREKDL